MYSNEPIFMEDFCWTYLISLYKNLKNRETGLFLEHVQTFGACISTKDTLGAVVKMLKFEYPPIRGLSIICQVLQMTQSCRMDLPLIRVIIYSQLRSPVKSTYFSVNIEVSVIRESSFAIELEFLMLLTRFWQRYSKIIIILTKMNA